MQQGALLLVLAQQDIQQGQQALGTEAALDRQQVPQTGHLHGGDRQPPALQALQEVAQLRRQSRKGHRRRASPRTPISSWSLTRQ